MKIFLSTTGVVSPVVFADLGARQFVDPTTNYELTQEYTPEEIANSLDVANALANGHITLQDDKGNPILDLTDFQGGDMRSSIYDPQDINGDAFDANNHTTNISGQSVQDKLDDLDTNKANEIDLQNHINDTNNPHAVEADQIPTDNTGETVQDNLTNLNVDSHTHPNKGELDKVTDGDHDIRTDNPHSVNKTDVGLGNVPNLDTTDAVNKAHDQNTDIKLDEGGANEVTASEARSHIDDTNNPHNTDIENLGSGTLAELNSKITDANLDDENDPRTPTGSAGGDLGGSYPNPIVNDGADSTAIHDNIPGEIDAIAEKVTPVSDDIVIIEDSEDSNNKKKAKLSKLISSGSDSDFAVSTGESSTTLTSYQQKVRLTFTPTSQGDYEVLYSAMVSHADTGVFINTRVQLDDTTTYHEIKQELNNFKYSDGAYYSRSGAFVLQNLTAVEHNIDFDFNTGDSGKATYIKEAYLIIRRIG